MLCRPVSDQRDISMAAGHTFWPEGNHVGIFFSFILYLIAYPFGKKASNNKKKKESLSLLDRLIRLIPQGKILGLYNALFKI